MKVTKARKPVTQLWKLRVKCGHCGSDLIIEGEDVHCINQNVIDYVYVCPVCDATNFITPIIPEQIAREARLRPYKKPEK